MGPSFYRLTYFSLHVNRPSNPWDTTFSKFDLENLRPMSWVRWMLKVTTSVQHSVDSHPFHSMSICHLIPEIRLFRNLTLKIQGHGHGWGQSGSHKMGVTSYRFTSFSFHVNRPSRPEIKHFQNLTLKIQGQCQMTMMLHNYRSRQFHKTWNGINPPSGFKDMSPAQLQPDLKSFWPMDKPIWGKWANNYNSAQLQV